VSEFVAELQHGVPIARYVVIGTRWSSPRCRIRRRNCKSWRWTTGRCAWH